MYNIIKLLMKNAYSLLLKALNQFYGYKISTHLLENNLVDLFYLSRRGECSEWNTTILK